MDGTQDGTNDPGATAGGTPQDPTGGATPPPPPPAWSAPAAAPRGVPADSRNWAMGAHLSAILGFTIIGPLVVWLVKKDTDEFVAHHAREALNFNITMAIATVAGVVLGGLLALVTLGIGLIVLIPAGLVVIGAYYVLSIIACVKAAGGEGYRYPFTIRLVT
ncbi:MAG: DUF4870 domain-containing protein [Actinomycetes bacterium]